MSTVTKRSELYTQVTKSIIESLEQGVRPWHKPWVSVSDTDRINRPMRHDGEKYTGINVVTLWMQAQRRGYTSPYWLTYNQTEKLGGYVMKGEEGASVVYVGHFTKKEANEEGDEVEREIPFMRSYSIFNAEQTKGLPLRFYLVSKSVRSIPPRRIEQAEQFFANAKAEMRIGGDRAYYSPTLDYIAMPPFSIFKDAESHAATLAHELTHWTAHPTRLNRDFGGKRWGDENYAFEELVAELASAFLCADLAITPEVRDDHASYIANWLSVLNDDKRAIFTAASHASRAVDYLHGLQPKAAE